MGREVEIEMLTVVTVATVVAEGKTSGSDLTKILTC